MNRVWFWLLVKKTWESPIGLSFSKADARKDWKLEYAKQARDISRLALVEPEKRLPAHVRPKKVVFFVDTTPTKEEQREEYKMLRNKKPKGKKPVHFPREDSFGFL